MYRGKVNFFAFCIGVAIFIAASICGNAQITTAQAFSGRATGINSTVTSNGSVISNAVAGDTCPLPDRGGTSTTTTSGVITPGTIGTGTIVSTTSGSGITSQSSSSVSDLYFVGGGWTVRATNISTSTQCNCCDIASPGCSGSTSITGLTVTDPSGAAFPITITGAPNQVVTLPNGAGTLTFDERSSATGSLTVNGLHIHIINGATVYDVIVASSHSNIICSGLLITAGEVNIAGHVVDQSGNPIARAAVSITSSQGQVVSTTSSAVDGSYTLTKITAGQTYIVQASAKKYIFTPRTINVMDDVAGFDLVGSSAH
jgi:Carboxypeptidase regulatory-like domain